MTTLIKKIARDVVRDSVISTIRLPVPQGSYHFETMVFGGPLDGTQMRYSSIERANHGHVKMVGKVIKAYHAIK